ncbi:MAG: glycoside hydrolase family 16 protein [Lentimicrobium sp.]|nr:glycoside hydrolase family 16 protein [Lentimicrobium sp.]
MMLVSSTSCKEEDQPEVTVDPTNLVVEVTIPNPDLGIVNIQASADNTTEYSLHIGSADQPVATNETGTFEYEFTESGTFEITVRAYGTSGRYISAVKPVVIIDNDPVTIADGYITPMQYAGYQLAWNDEFSGNALNTQYWSYETGGEWSNNELQYYRQENTTVADQVLTIEARKENYGGRSYTSSRLVTRNKKSFKYGRIDIRALLPKGQGIWPALWALGDNITTQGWPKCGETDIMEMIGGSGRENTVYGTVHWDQNGNHADYGNGYTLPTGTFADEYHVFSIIWDATSIKWYVNNIQYSEADITPAQMSEFHQPQFFIFNVAVGGNWPGNPDATTIFPQQLKVDYIRVFQSN